MQRNHFFILGIIFFFFSGSSFAQKSDQKAVDSIFYHWGEIYFKFHVQDKSRLDDLTKMISIDNYKNQEVFAYANKPEFEAFRSLGIPYTILPNPGGLLKGSEILAEKSPEGQKTVGLWNFYPTYQQYVDTMLYYASAYPDICHLDTIGTSVLGRKILSLKISDFVEIPEAEPEFFYTSSMHGDETTGYVLMLHLIDSLVRGYNVSPRITNIVNHTEIFINPLANPDGTYGSGNTISNPTRENYNGYDLNRNFPDPGNVNTGVKQPETLAFMDYATHNHFVMSANFHGGAELVNYPWDRWSRLNADDNWWQFVSREYADTAHKYSFAGYFNDENNGITNGYAWYSMYGGRQDYMNFFHHCRESTIEISSTHFLAANKLLAYWGYNYHSFLNYMEQVNYGFQGIITDTVTGERLRAKVFVINHDKDIDSSSVYSKLPSGFYARPIYQGNYDVTFSAPGYFPKTISDISILNKSTLSLDIQLKPLTFGIKEKTGNTIFIFPNPSRGSFSLVLPLKDTGEWNLEIKDLTGKKVLSHQINAVQPYSVIPVNLEFLPSGIYLVVLSNKSQIFQDKLMIQK